MSVEEKRQRLRELREQALGAGREDAIARQHARGKLTARERIDAAARPGVVHRAGHVHPPPGPRLRPRGQPPLGRRRRHRARHDRRPAGVRVQPGLHRVRRQPGRGLRRQDHQGDGSGRAHGLPGHRHQRLGRRPHPGGRGLARPATPTSSCATSARAGSIPQISRGPGPLRRRRRLQPGDHRLHLHGARDQPHVHHRPRGDQDGHRRGRDDGGAGRCAVARDPLGRVPFRHRFRAGVPRSSSGT